MASGNDKTAAFTVVWKVLDVPSSPEIASSGGGPGGTSWMAIMKPGW